MIRLPMILTVGFCALLFISSSIYAQCPDYFTFDDGEVQVYYNHVIDGIGDINDDGHDDIIYNTDEGVVIRSGQTGLTIRTHLNASEPVAGVGDVNGDGVGDYVIRGAYSPSRLELYSGVSGVKIRDLPIGLTVAGAGDVNNDGVLDIIVGNPHSGCDLNGMQRQHSEVYVISGASSDTLRAWVSPCGSSWSFGDAVAGMGDVNGDGYDDIAIGAPSNDKLGVNVGQVAVISGQDQNDTLSRWYGKFDNDAIGAVIANAGDVNNDGTNDIIVGRPESGSQARAIDSAWVFSCQQDSVQVIDTGVYTIDTIWVYGDTLLYGLSDGGDQLDRFGRAVDGLGDVNHDGYDDFVVGAYRYGNNNGRVHVYSGIDGTEIYNHVGPNSATAIGKCIAGVGDVNGDGMPDLAATAYMKPDIMVFTCVFQTQACLDGADTDGDGRGDECDNCPDVYNAWNPQYTFQEDADHDGIGDKCDECTDSDWDGYGDDPFLYPTSVCAVDNCPDINNPDQSDIDGDGVGDVCDDCPDIYNPEQTDTDTDGIADECDNCPVNSNSGQQDADQDGAGDSCDNCRYDINPDQADADGDGDGDLCDNCPDVANSSQQDIDSDNLGDACDECSDSDGDGYGQPDPYGSYSAQTCPEDNCYQISNPDQADVDADGYGDACDNCPDHYNPDQEDRNYDGRGDSCVTTVPTPTGDAVEVDLGEGVSLTIEYVGNETLAEIYTTQNDPPPDGAFGLLPNGEGTVYHIDVDWGTSGPYTICINYDPTGMTAADEDSVRLYHGEEQWNTQLGKYENVWVDVTTELDTAANSVCGQVDYFSPFAIGIVGGSCCVGKVGDVNLEGGDEPTIGDIALLVDALFIGQDWGVIPCLEEVDINQSGGVAPVAGEGGDITIGDVALLVDALFIVNDWTVLPDCL